MAAQHTPGDWFITRTGFSTVYVESRIGGGLIQEVAACGPTNEGPHQQEANARLIANSPELLEVVVRLSAQATRLRLPGQSVTDAEEAALAVIAKVTGSTS